MMWCQCLFLLAFLSVSPLTLADKDRVEQGICRYKGDLVFVLDSSGSIQEENPLNWGRMLQFMSDIVDRLNVGYYNVRVGAVRFSQEAKNLFYLEDTVNVEDVKRRIHGIEYDGLLTATGDGLELMRTQQFSEDHGDRPDVPNVALVITDGESNMYPAKTREQADLAHRQGITVLAVGIGEKVNVEELRDISSLPRELNKTYFMSPDFQALTNIVATIDNTICSSLRIELPGDQLTSTVPPAHHTDPLPTLDYSGESSCPYFGDLVFVVDGSVDVASGKDKAWPLVTSFLTELVNYFYIDLSRVRVGLVRFSNSAENIWRLSRTRNREATMDGLRALQMVDGDTNIYDGLRQMRTHQFQYVSGARSWMPHVAVLITDGHSTNLHKKTYEEAAAAKRAGIHIFTVGIGDGVDMGELQTLASPSTGDGKRTYFFAPSFGMLPSNVIPLKEAICRVFDNHMRTPDYSYVTDTDGPGTPTQPYVTPYTSMPPLTGEADVVLVFDASNSALGPGTLISSRFAEEASRLYGSQQEAIVLPFVKTLMGQNAFTYGPHAGPVGVVSFGDWPVHHRFFNGHTHEPPYFLYNDIQRAPFVGGHGNLALAMEAVRTVQFSQYRGHRPGVHKMVVFFLNGLGLAGQDEARLRQEARRMYEEGIRVYAVDVSGHRQTRYAKLIATQPAVLGKTYWDMADDNASLGLTAQMKNRGYVWTTPSPRKTSGGWRPAIRHSLVILMCCVSMLMGTIASLHA